MDIWLRPPMTSNIVTSIPYSIRKNREKQLSLAIVLVCFMQIVFICSRFKEDAHLGMPQTIPRKVELSIDLERLKLSILDEMGGNGSIENFKVDGSQELKKLMQAIAEIDDFIPSASVVEDDELEDVQDAMSKKTRKIEGRYGHIMTLTSYKQVLRRKDKLVKCNRLIVGQGRMSSSYGVISASNYNEMVQVHCCNSPSYRPIRKDRHHNLTVIYNYMPASKTYACNETITLTTHGDVKHLINVPTLAARWAGPIEVIVFAPGPDIVLARHAITFLRKCHYEVAQNVSFHIVFPSHLSFSQKDDKNWSKLFHEQGPRRHPGSCSLEDKLANITTFKEMFDAPYQVNVARNMARRAATTYFVLATDVEMYPSATVIPRFMDMIKDNPHVLHPDPPQVFALPEFEVAEDRAAPKMKWQLSSLWAAGKVRTFHKETCKACHAIPNERAWMSEPESDTFSIWKTVQRKESLSTWEPVYIGTNLEPEFDERLSWNGQRDKIMQAYVMCLLNYTFHILDSAFLVHRPGFIKTKLVDPLSVYNQDSLIYKSLRKEYVFKYGVNEGCH